MKAIIFCIVVCWAGLGAQEIYDITAPFGEEGLRSIFPDKSNAKIFVDQDYIWIPNGSDLTLISRDNPLKNETIDIRLFGGKAFTITAVVVSEPHIVMIISLSNGQKYLYRTDLDSHSKFKPVSRHCFNNGLHISSNQALLVSGCFRPFYAEMLSRYDHNIRGGQTVFEKEKFKTYFENSKAFTVSRYDFEFNLLDSANVIQRTGVNGKRFDLLANSQVMDISKDGKLFVLDGSTGYSIERYSSDLIPDTSIMIRNEKFESLPDEITEAYYLQALGGKEQYSIPYCLVISDNLMLCSFYRSVAVRQTVQGPYYYDILDTSGVPLVSGQLPYPIITADAAGGVLFYYVCQEGGWFGKDRGFLVSTTIKELQQGAPAKKDIDDRISHYLASKN